MSGGYCRVTMFVFGDIISKLKKKHKTSSAKFFSLRIWYPSQSICSMEGLLENVMFNPFIGVWALLMQGLGLLQWRERIVQAFPSRINKMVGSLDSYHSWPTLTLITQELSWGRDSWKNWWVLLTGGITFKWWSGQSLPLPRIYFGNLLELSRGTERTISHSVLFRSPQLLKQPPYLESPFQWAFFFWVRQRAFPCLSIYVIRLLMCMGSGGACGVKTRRL